MSVAVLLDSALSGAEPQLQGENDMSEPRENSEARSAETWIGEFERVFIVPGRIRNEKARRLAKGRQSLETPRR